MNTEYKIDYTTIFQSKVINYFILKMNREVGVFEKVFISLFLFSFVCYLTFILSYFYRLLTISSTDSFEEKHRFLFIFVNIILVFIICGFQCIHLWIFTVSDLLQTTEIKEH